MPKVQHNKLKHQRLTEYLRRQMESGALKIGDRLPSFAEMKEQQGASQATMERVYAQLEQEGLITRQPGRGTFAQSAASAGRSRATATHPYWFYRSRFRATSQLVIFGQLICRHSEGRRSREPSDFVAGRRFDARFGKSGWRFNL